MSQETIDRWSGFLAKIEARFGELMQEAVAGCGQLFEAHDGDPTAMGRAWGAIEIRAKELRSKISDTWHAQVDDALDGAPPGVRVRERERGEALEDRIDVGTEATRLRIYADAARKLWTRAMSERPQHLQCTQCAAGLAMPDTIQAVNVKCPHCGSLVTWEPGTRLRMIEHFCVPTLCDEACWQLWLARRAAEQGRRGHHGDDLPNLKAHEQAYVAYERAWLEARARMLPQHAPDLDKDLRGRVAQFYQMLDRERAWIEAGRPRIVA
jgi:hypothetical protein